MKWRNCAMLALPWGLALAGPPAPPASSAPAPARAAAAPARAAAAASASATAAADAELLEFLGSVDSAEPGWHDYLEHTDLEKVIHAPAPPAPPTHLGNRT
jgi:hypothetical protein